MLPLIVFCIGGLIAGIGLAALISPERVIPVLLAFSEIR